MLKSVKIVLVSLLALLLIASIIIAVELGSLAYMLANPDEPYVAYTTERYTAQEIESLFFQHKSEFEQIAKIITNEKQFADWYNSPRIGNTNMELGYRIIQNSKINKRRARNNQELLFLARLL